MMRRFLVSPFILLFLENIHSVYFVHSRCAKMTAILSNAIALVALLSSVAALPQARYSNSSTNAYPSTNLCGNDQHIILEGTTWLVANSMYGAASMVGTSCTYYDHMETSQVVWSSTTHIQDLPGT